MVIEAEPLVGRVLRVLVLAGSAAWGVHAQIPNFQHIVVIVQENRTPDNLFQGLCRPPYGSKYLCSTNPGPKQYDIQTADWLDKNSSTGVTQPAPVPLANSYDLSHAHSAFLRMCDRDPTTSACKMDGAGNIACIGTCPPKPQFRYVNNDGQIVRPYLQLARQYGWANYMFQTNQGPSFPAHQFLFGGTSAPTAADDAAGVFAAENTAGPSPAAGCIADASTTVALIGPQGEDRRIYPCFEHSTMADVLPVTFSWPTHPATWAYHPLNGGD